MSRLDAMDEKTSEEIRCVIARSVPQETPAIIQVTDPTDCAVIFRFDLSQRRTVGEMAVLLAGVIEKAVDRSRTGDPGSN